MKKITSLCLLIFSTILLFMTSCKKDSLIIPKIDQKIETKSEKNVHGKLLPAGQRRSNIKRKKAGIQLMSGMSRTQVRLSFNYIILDHAAEGYTYDDITAWGDELLFIEDLNGDDLTMTEIMLEVEDEFGIEIYDEDFEKLHTIGEWVSFIFEAISEKETQIPQIPTHEQQISDQLNAILHSGDYWYFTSVGATNPSFSSVTSFSNVINGLDYTTSSGIEIGNSKPILFRINQLVGLFSGGIDINVIIKKNASSNAWELTQVTSNDWGFVLGTSWEQNSYTENTANHIITIDLIGYQSWSILVDGLGTFYKKKLIYRMKINNITGEPVSLAKIN